MSSSLFSQKLQINRPQIDMIKNMLSGKGISAEQMVRTVCKQRGIDVNALLKQAEEFANSNK